MNVRGPWLYAFMFTAVFSAFPGVAAAEKKSSESVEAVPAPASYLNPAVTAGRRAKIVHLQQLRSRLLEKIGSDLDNASVYVEDMKSGVWVGINERLQVGLGSLLKVPVMMSWMKWDQGDPGILEKKITVTTADLNPSDRFARAVDEPLRPGEYRVLFLIERMIAHSDNTALNALSRSISKYSIHETFVDIGVPNPFLETKQPDRFGKLSAKQYANIMKALYNASYLDVSHSEQALRILTRSRFDKGLRQVIPKGTTAALKYGFWEGTAFHESGIVYYNDNPYLICVFTYLNKEDVHQNLKLIREIGGVVQSYFEEEVTRR